MSIKWRGVTHLVYRVYKIFNYTHYNLKGLDRFVQNSNCWPAKQDYDRICLIPAPVLVCKPAFNMALYTALPVIHQVQSLQSKYVCTQFSSYEKFGCKICGETDIWRGILGIIGHISVQHDKINYLSRYSCNTRQSLKNVHLGEY